VIYLDTSVALAALFAEERAPPQKLWSQLLISSRLFEYEIMNRVNARGLGPTHVDAARVLIDSVDLLELQRDILVRALQPFPQPVRTLDRFTLHQWNSCADMDKRWNWRLTISVSRTPRRRSDSRWCRSSVPKSFGSRL